MYPLQNRWTVWRYLQYYENFSERCTHLILPETALFSPTPTFAKEPFFSEKKESVRLYQTEKSRKVERRCSLLATPHKACVVLPFVFIDCLPFPETCHGGSVCPKPPVPTSSPVCHSCSTGQWKCRRGAKTFPTLQYTPAPSVRSGRS